MLGWEYPPQITGGLGIACQGLAEALAEAGHDVTFLLPRKSKKQVSKKVSLMDAASIKPDFSLWKKQKQHIEALREVEIGQYLMPYLPAEAFVKVQEKQKVTKIQEDTDESRLLDQITLTGTYGENLQAELMKYALLAVQVAKTKKFDLIHAHDWVTFKAGIMASQLTKSPLFVHVHSTEHDRNGMHAQQFVIDEERTGMEQADQVFCVSSRLKNSIREHYAIPDEKLSVIPNAVEILPPASENHRKPRHIAFVGRLTHQKSPTSLIDIARDLTSRGHDFSYSIIGDGFLRGELENNIKHVNLTDRFRFTGFLERTTLLKELSAVDLLVVPSLSEPFGLVILEAIMKNIPVAASKDVGIAEFIPSLPQVDRWDLYSFGLLAEKLMTNQKYRSEVVKSCRKEAGDLSWSRSAELVSKKYK